MKQDRAVVISFESFKTEDGKPIYQQILDFIKRGAVSGAIKNGDELPSRRVLSALLGINPNTVQKAFRLLEDEGLIESRAGSGSVMTLSPERTAEIRAELKALKDDAYRIKGAIKEATRENSRYNRAIRPYAEAQKLLTQKENYTRFSEIEARYDAAVAREAEAEAAAKALAEQEAEERRRDKERRLEERKNRK